MPDKSLICKQSLGTNLCTVVQFFLRKTKASFFTKMKAQNKPLLLILQI